ncbi:MAG: outer membrane beta-barrel protein [Betaproteobacteria bacterium]|nr:outer membrane beta-barrel protein [Betaproteobacteria bacterium]
MNNKQRRFAVLAGGLVTLLGFQAGLVVAQEDDSKSPFTFSVSQTFGHDSNLYRLPDELRLGQSVPKGKRSDSFSETRVGVNFDKEYSRQSFHAGLAVDRIIYRTHSDLNNTSPDARLRWDWRIGDRWSGVLGYSWNESRVNFDNTYNEQKRIMRRIGRANASADFWWHPNWATGFAFSDVRNDYSSGARPLDKYDAQEASLNFTYRPSTGNRIVLSLRAEDGQYPNRQKKEELLVGESSLRDWERRDVRLSGSWRLTGVTQVSGYAGYTQRKYDLAPDRDFSGFTGSLAFKWTPTGKAIIDLSWRREIGADEDSVSNYAVTQVWAFRPTWVVTSKVRLGASYEYRHRSYDRDPEVLLLNNPESAKTTSYGVNLQYLPTSYANIALGYRHQKRDAKEGGFDYGYGARTVWLSGGLTF